MTLQLELAAVILAPVLFAFWIRWRLRIREELRAWKPCAGYLELKLCPKCGGTALEGEVECIGCGHAPEDDSTWRELRGELYEERQKLYDAILYGRPRDG